MAITYINTGSSANKGDGDTLRTAFNKINANFELIGQELGSSGTYVLPVASATTIGGIKIGANLTIADGVLSANASGGVGGDFSGTVAVLTATNYIDLNGIILSNNSGTLSAVIITGTTPPDYVELLLHADDFADDSGKNVDILNNGVTVSTSTSKFGTGSFYFDGASYISLPNSASNPAFDQTGDITIEFWLYNDAFNVGTIIASEGLTGVHWSIQNAGGKLYFQCNDGVDAFQIIPSPDFPVGVWTHCAVVKSGTVVTIFQGGAPIGSVDIGSSTAFNDTIYDITIGSIDETQGFFLGYLDEIRISRGVALYSTNFAPPTDAFPGDTLLIQSVLPLFDFENINSHVLPSANVVYDLGSPTFQWRSLYVGTGTVYIGGVALTIDTATNAVTVGTSTEQTVLATETYVDTAISNIPAGPTGTVATINIGEVTTGSAAVTNTGTIYDAYLNFTIPQGEQGPQGETGAQGVGLTLVGSSATTTVETLGEGSAGQGWINTTDGDVYFWNTLTTLWENIGPISGPQGLQGEQGVQGIKGDTGTAATVTIGTVSVSTTTAAVTNVGTEQAVVLDFVLLQGPAGADGANAAATTSTLVNGTSTISLSTDGVLTFPDSTEQTTAWTGTFSYSNLTDTPIIPDAFTSTAVLANGASTISLDANGTLEIAGTIISPTSISLEAAGGVSVISDVGNTSNFWYFSETGTLSFPDSSVQTTAWTGTIAYSNITDQPTIPDASTLVNGNFTASLGSDGNLTIPGDVSVATASTTTYSAITVDTQIYDIGLEGGPNALRILQADLVNADTAITVGAVIVGSETSASVTSSVIDDSTATGVYWIIPIGDTSSSLFTSTIDISVFTTGITTWQFNADSSLTFPDATVQTTAWTTTSNYTPTTPTDWLGSPTVGTITSGLDELAYRMIAVEGSVFTSTSTLVNGAYIVSLETDGRLTLAGNVQFLYQVVQATTDGTSCAASTGTVVYTSSDEFKHTIKLLVEVEGAVVNGDPWDTQSCEIIVAKSFRNNQVAATVYAVVHTSVSPLATFTAVWNALTSRVDVVCTPASTEPVFVRTFATEIQSSD